MLISTLSRSGCSKSIIQPMTTDDCTHSHAESFPEWDPSSSLLHIWLFNKNIAFTSTARTESLEAQSGQDGEDEAAIPAVKVLYRLVSREEADRLGQSITSDVQDIALPDAVVRGVRKLLEQSTVYLPENDRKFGGLWSVGLLEKWKSSS
jgi:ubiquitin-protein ligase E3 D